MLGHQLLLAGAEVLCVSTACGWTTSTVVYVATVVERREEGVSGFESRLVYDIGRTNAPTAKMYADVSDTSRLPEYSWL